MDDSDEGIHADHGIYEGGLHADEGVICFAFVCCISGLFVIMEQFTK